MGRKLRFLRHPDRVMRQSKSTAMAAVVRLIQRGEEELPEIYKRSLKLWGNAKQKRNKRRVRIIEENNETWKRPTKDPNYFIPICDIEKYLRKNHLTMIFNTTALNGSKEVKRVYRWSEGTIGPLNSLLNIAGARLRYLAMTRYPFPKPTRIMVERISKKGRKYYRWHYGYGGSSQHPTVIIVHPHLPSLDFVDLIRGHLFELCRQCFILAVTSRDAVCFINLLILRLRPFLDHIYIGGTKKTKKIVGTDDFLNKAEKELDKIINMLRGRYGTRLGYPERVTHRISIGPKTSLSLNDLLNSIPRGKQRKKLKSLEKQNIINDNDAKNFSSKVRETAARVGTRIHKRISWGLVNPFTSRTIVFGGDYLTKESSGYLLSAEVPVESGRGKPDFTLFVRRSVTEEQVESEVSGLWCPLFTLDLKTKSAFDWGFVGHQEKKDGPKIFDTHLNRKRLTDGEWQVAIENTPSRIEKTQVNLYGDSLLGDYHKFSREDPNPPPMNIRGILLMDGMDYPSRIRRFLKDFIIKVYESIRYDLDHLIKLNPNTKISYLQSVFKPRLSWPVKTRLAIVVLPFKVPSGVSVNEFLPPAALLPTIHEPNPFENRIVHIGQFILYLATASSGSSGDSAALIARHWHGLDFIVQFAEEQERKSVVWIDLSGDFADETIRYAFLRLHKRKRKKREFYETIRFVDLSAEIEAVLFEGATIPTVATLKEITNGHDLIVVSGMDVIRSVAPPDSEEMLETLAVHFAEGLSAIGCTTLWFDSPVPLATTSALYKQHQFQPLAFDSPLQTILDEIVLNLPFPPKSGGGEASSVDYTRGIIRISPDKANGADIESVIIPPLFGWSKRFRNREVFTDQTIRREKVGKELASSSFLASVLAIPQFTEELAVELFPFLNSWIGFHMTEEEKDRNLLSLEVERITSIQWRKQHGYRGVLSRLTFSKELCEPSGEKEVELSRIDTKRLYRTTKLKLEPWSILPLPPDEVDIEYISFNKKLAAIQELQRIFDVAMFLRNKGAGYELDLSKMLVELLKVITEATKQPKSETTEMLRTFLKNNPYTSSVWNRFEWHRSILLDWPMPSRMREEIERQRFVNKDFLLHYGNYLILLLSSLWGSHTFSDIEITKLWDVIRPWITLQLGAQQRSKRPPKSEFNAQAVYTQLQSRIQYISGITSPTAACFSKIRYGVMVEFNHNSDKYRWYIFERQPYELEFITGCLSIPSSQSWWNPFGALRTTSVMPLDELRLFAKLGEETGIVIPMMIANHRGYDILFQIVSESELEIDKDFSFQEFNWRPTGQIRYRTRYRGAVSRLRYVSITSLGGSRKYPDISEQILPKRMRKMSEKLLKQLSNLQQYTSDVTRVRCTVSYSNNKYSIRFYPKSGIRTSTPLHTVNCDENHAVRILTSPHYIGIPFGPKLTWDPLKDIGFGKSRKLNDLVIGTIMGG